MAKLIGAEELFKQLTERSRDLSSQIRTTYAIAGEAAMQGLPVSETDKVYVRSLEARRDEIDSTIKMMQKLASE